MALSNADIKVLYADETGFILDDSPAALLDFAKALEAEVRKQDTDLIRQMRKAARGCERLPDGNFYYIVREDHYNKLLGYERAARAAQKEGEKP